VGGTQVSQAMKHLPVSLVSVYTYINPAVAVILGALIYGEKFGAIEIAAMAIIFVGVLMVKRFSEPSESKLHYK
jgi:drug/metabolite transporter (DMT)-like permease